MQWTHWPQSGSKHLTQEPQETFLPPPVSVFFVFSSRFLFWDFTGVLGASTGFLMGDLTITSCLLMGDFGTSSSLLLSDLIGDFTIVSGFLVGDFTGDLGTSSCLLVDDLEGDLSDCELLLRLFVASFFFIRLALYKEFFSLLFKILLVEGSGLLLLDDSLFCFKILEFFDNLLTMPWWIPI